MFRMFPPNDDRNPVVSKPDWPELWCILKPIFRAGDTFSFATDISGSEARQNWVERPAFAFVAETDEGTLLGSYYIMPNQAGQGAHVCNCGDVVGAAARGQDVASLMCERFRNKHWQKGCVHET